MLNNPQDPEKVLADKLAHLLITGSENKEQIGSLIKTLNSFRITAPQALPGAGKQTGQRPADVGIWTPRLADGLSYYQRNPVYRSQYKYWAKVEVIPPKNSRKRIVLLGESVARGYFYDPYFTPATVLESVLAQEMDAEVIDLARNDIGLHELMELSLSCLKLEPDALVIFAGNNWAEASFLTSSDFAGIVDSFSREAPALAVKAIFEQRFRTKVEEFVKHIEKISLAHRVPVVILIPEFNLLDWHPNTTARLPPRLPGNGSHTWLQMRDQAEGALKGQDIRMAESAALAMRELDAGTHVLSNWLLGRCKLHQGALQEARTYFESARDTALLSPGLVAPRRYAIVREVLLEKFDPASEHIQVIDLQSVFAHYLNGSLPGRRMFLDYCHLTSEGISVAMANAARGVLQMLGQKAASPEAILSTVKSPPDDVAARAHLFAAVHNAHLGQPKEILSYHCNKALEADELVAELMESLVELASQLTYSHLCAAYEKLVQSELLIQHPLALLDVKKLKVMDVALVDAIVELLEPVNKTIKERVHTLRMCSHSVAHKKINLLESYYSLTWPFQYHYNSAVYFQTWDISSAFYFVAEKKTPLTGRLTCRVPSTSQGIPAGSINIKVNGIWVAEEKITNCWKDYEFTIPVATLLNGVNEAVVFWPVYEQHPATPPFQQALSPFEAIHKSLYLKIAQIHAFTIEPQEV